MRGQTPENPLVCKYNELSKTSDEKSGDKALLFLFYTLVENYHKCPKTIFWQSQTNLTLNFQHHIDKPALSWHENLSLLLISNDTFSSNFFTIVHLTVTKRC